MTYITKSGEMWDEIAKKTLGAEKYLVELVKANRQHINTFIFGAGVVLTLPVIEEKTTLPLPPWRR